jgi:hypothetical protein
MFEIGKFYEHSSGKTLKIISAGITDAHGWCLIGEDGKGLLQPVGNHDGAFTGWELKEIESDI